MTRQPALVSLAFRDIPEPDWADVVVVTLPAGADNDPAEWAQAVFDIRALPAWVLALLGLRQLLVGLIGVDRGAADVFAVREVSGEEALIAADDRHLDFRAGVAVDTDAGLLRCVTAVRLKGWRGQVYFAPIRLLHDPITRAMMRAAVRRSTHAADLSGH